jgi:citrate synthase
MSTHLSAHEAAAELGISVSTLYAYVSRGLIRSEGQSDTRQRRYLAEDVWLLKQRKVHRRDPIKSSADALHWGLPVLSSRLSVIQGGRLYYAGRDVVSLATDSRLEQVAALLWSDGDEQSFPGEDDAHVPSSWPTLMRLASPLPPLEAFQLFLPVVAAADPAAYDLQPDSVRRTGARILRLLAAVAVGAKPSGAPVVDVLRRGWSLKGSDAASLLEAALILYAENGLNPSSFTARCVASAGASPYAVVSAGLAALQGAKHGGASERAGILFEEARSPESARQIIAARLRRGESLPGFGHPLYPDGDPRGAVLLDLIAKQRPKAPEVVLALTLVDTVRDVTNQQPNVDFGVVTLCRALRLPPGAPLALLGVARTVGWIAHALEQYQEGRVIRPRAQYAGREPQTDNV